MIHAHDTIKAPPSLDNKHTMRKDETGTSDSHVLNYIDWLEASTQTTYAWQCIWLGLSHLNYTLSQFIF